MIRFLLRFAGLVCLAAAFILVVYDGMKSIGSNALFITSVRGLWELLNAASLQSLEAALKAHLGGLLWDPLMVAILAAPSWAMLAFAGVVLMLIGRKRKPLIGYAR